MGVKRREIWYITQSVLMLDQKQELRQGLVLLMVKEKHLVLDIRIDKREIINLSLCGLKGVNYVLQNE